MNWQVGETVSTKYGSMKIIKNENGIATLSGDDGSIFELRLGGIIQQEKIEVKHEKPVNPDEEICRLTDLIAQAQAKKAHLATILA